jgi:hypothetical protein
MSGINWGLVAHPGGGTYAAPCVPAQIKKTSLRRVNTWPKSIVLESGSSDDVTAFRFNGGYYFVSVNRPLGYIGIDRYMDEDAGDTWHSRNGILWQYEHDVDAILGKKAFDYTPRHLLKIAIATYGEEL